MINTRIKLEYTYSDNAAKNVKQKAQRDILNAVESSPAMRKEIARVFHMANRRIQNIEKSGCISPAVRALDRNNGQFSKFAMSGHSWETLKVEYGRCISFLQQPTSTAKGCREWEKQSSQQLGLTNDEWYHMREDFIMAYNSGSDNILGKIPYTELMQEIYKRAEIIISQRMENHSRQIADALQREINSQAERIANNVGESVEDIISRLTSGKKL